MKKRSWFTVALAALTILAGLSLSSTASPVAKLYAKQTYAPSLGANKLPDAHFSDGQTLTSMSRLPQNVDIFFRPQNSTAVRMANYDQLQRCWNTTSVDVIPPDRIKSTSPVASIARYPNIVDVFYIGTDGAIWTSLYADNSTWRGPFRLTTPNIAHPDSSLSAISRAANTIDLYYIGTDGAIWTMFYGDTLGWRGPVKLTASNTVQAYSSLSAISRDPSVIDVYFVGTDRAVWTLVYGDTLGWRGPVKLSSSGVVRAGSASSRSPLSALARTSNVIDLFFVGSEGALWTLVYGDSAGWRGPFKLSADGTVGIIGSLSALSRVPTTIDLYYVGPNRDVSTIFYGDTLGWRGPVQLTNAGVAGLSTPLAAVASSDTMITVSWLDNAGLPTTIDYIDNQPWSQPFGIASQCQGRVINLSISLYRTPTMAEKPHYGDIIGHFADGIFEMTNGTHKIGTVSIFSNGQHAETANILWGARQWPNAVVAGWGKQGARINFGDVFPFSDTRPVPGTDYDALANFNRRGAGYTLAHEWGHYYYGLYDEYRGQEPCFQMSPSTPTQCDVTVTNSVMGNQWQGVQDLNWLNFSIQANQNQRNAHWRVYGASGWETLLRNPGLDRRNGQLQHLYRRTFFPELAARAPRGSAPPSIELPTAAARESLQINWMGTAMAGTNSVAYPLAYQPVLQSVSGSPILYPSAAILETKLITGSALVAKAVVTGSVITPNDQNQSLLFQDNGVYPDSRRDDGIYTSLLKYTTNGEYRISTTLSNDGHAEMVFETVHFTPGINGEVFEPTPIPLTDPFVQQVALTLSVTGIPADASSDTAPTRLTLDNADYPGKIDGAGDVDTFEFIADTTGMVILRSTDYSPDMRSVIKIYKGADPATFVNAYTFIPEDNKYFFTEIHATVGERFLIEVSHENATAIEGSFNMSVGEPLPQSIESMRNRIYLPGIVMTRH